MNYAIINNIAQYMPVHDNDKIKALCDAYHVPYEAVEEIFNCFIWYMICIT